MCQGCYSCRSFTNERCPLEPWQSRPVHIKVVAWPCIPDEVWINELWTSNSRITTHKSSSPARRNLQRTKMLEKKKKSTSTLPRFEHRDQERGAAGAAERIFQKPPIIWCVGEHNEVGRMPNGILYHTNKNFWQDVSAFQRAAHNKLLMRGSGKRFSCSALT